MERLNSNKRKAATIESSDTSLISGFQFQSSRRPNMPAALGFKNMMSNMNEEMNLIKGTFC